MRLLWLRIRSITWSRFPIKNIADWFLAYPLVESSYLNMSTHNLIRNKPIAFQDESTGVLVHWYIRLLSMFPVRVWAEQCLFRQVETGKYQTISGDYRHVSTYFPISKLLDGRLLGALWKFRVADARRISLLRWGLSFLFVWRCPIRIFPGHANAARLFSRPDFITCHFPGAVLTFFRSGQNHLIMWRTSRARRRVNESSSAFLRFTKSDLIFSLCWQILPRKALVSIAFRSLERIFFERLFC